MVGTLVKFDGGGKNTAVHLTVLGALVAFRFDAGPLLCAPTPWRDTRVVLLSWRTTQPVTWSIYWIDKWVLESPTGGWSARREFVTLRLFMLTPLPTGKEEHAVV